MAYLVPGNPNPNSCPACLNPNYLLKLANPSILNAQTSANISASATVYHCDNCQHNFSSTQEF